MTEKRYVSFLDILGFEGIVENNELDTIIKKFESVLYFTPYWQALGQWINFKGKIKHGSAKCSCFSFSDTFVLSTDDTSIESLNNILIATFLLARNVFAVGLPVRGAITAGEADYIPNTNHLIGMGDFLGVMPWRTDGVVTDAPADINTLVEQLNGYSNLLNCPVDPNSLLGVLAPDISDNQVDISTYIGEVDTETLALELEKLSPYYLSPDVVQYIIKFMISKKMFP